ncbi:MAG: hypothetical protein AAGF59_06820 [Pseudomonadota bacterium]
MTANIAIIDQSDRVERLFEPFRDQLGRDFRSYRGRVYRTLTYAMQFLNGDEQAQPMVETVFVYHDIALWTDNKLAYLQPSEAHALADNGKYDWGLNPLASARCHSPASHIVALLTDRTKGSSRLCGKRIGSTRPAEKCDKD